MKLVNHSFDDSASFNDNFFLNKIMSCFEISKILQNLKLDLELRTEIIQFFRIVYTDISVNSNEISKYRTEFCSNQEVEEDVINKNEDLKIFAFLHDLMKISQSDQESIFEREFQIYLDELKNFENIIENNKQLDKSMLLYYLENGLFLSLKVYFNKVFSAVFSMEGKQFLKIYELTYNMLLLKIFLLTNTNKFFSEDGQGERDKIKARNSKKETSIKKLESKVIKLDKLTEHEIEIVEATLDSMRDLSFQVFDFISLYDIIDKHFMSMIQQAQSSSIINAFIKKNVEDGTEQDKRLNEEIRLKGAKSIEEKKLLKLLMIYEKDKINFLESSIIQNLSDLHISFDVNYRNLLLKYLFFSANSKNLMEGKFYEIFSKDTYGIILKLLQCDTTAVQKEIKNLIINESMEKLGMQQLADTLFTNLIGVFFSSYNPSSISFTDDYYIACNIIKIFKYMCEEHNNFFQSIFLKKLIFEFSPSHRASFLPEIKGKDHITFFDLVLSILNKIVLISGWGKVRSSEGLGESDYFYDLFSCLIEFLIEMVQGSSSNNFSAIIKEDKNIKFDELEYLKSKSLSLRKSTTQLQIFNQMLNEENKLKALPVFLSNIKNIIFNDISTSQLIFNVKNELANFILAFLEEKNCPMQIKLVIISHFHPQSVLTTIAKTLKKLYIKLSGISKNSMAYKNITFNTHENQKRHNSNNSYNYPYLKEQQSKNEEPEKVKIEFDDRLYDFLISKYFNDEQFTELPEFRLCNTLFRYFKLIGLEYNNSEALKIMDKINSLDYYKMMSVRSKEPGVRRTEADINEDLFDSYVFDNFFTIKFFEHITRTIQIQLEDQSVTRVIFNLPPLLNYLSTNTKTEFFHSVNRDNRHSKLSALIEHSEYFKDEILYNLGREKKNILFKISNKFSYYYISLFCFTINVLINIYMVFFFGNEVKYYDNELESECSSAAEHRRLLRYLSEIEANSHDINSSILENTTISNATDILHTGQILTNLIRKDSILMYATSNYMASFQLFINLSVFILWCFTKLPLVLKINQKHYKITKNLDDKNLSFLTRFKLLFQTIFSRDDTTVFLWNIILNIIVLSNDEMEFFFAVQLIIVFKLSVTLKNIAKSITMRFKQLISTFLLLIVVQYVYAALGFYFFNERFFNSTMQENECETFLSCFLTHIADGLKRHGGVGDIMPNSSFLIDQPYFYGFLLFKVMYFIICIVLLLNIIFGIIIDTFRELRIKYQQNLYDQLNRCFICSVERDELEKECIHYEIHIEEDHNMWNYVYYIITLKFTDSQELNSINSYAMNLIQNKAISWIPIHKKKHLEEEEQVKEETDKPITKLNKKNTNNYTQISYVLKSQHPINFGSHAN
jgi:hypothetical protein